MPYYGVDLDFKPRHGQWEGQKLLTPRLPPEKPKETAEPSKKDSTVTSKK